MNDQLLLERLAGTDVCPAQAPLPREAWSRDVALAEIERRVGMQTRERTEQMVPEYRTSRGWLVAAAAFVGVLVVGTAMLFWLARSDGPEVVDEPHTPTTTAAPQTTAPVTTTPPTTAAAALTTTTVGAAPVAAPVPSIEWVEVELDVDMGWFMGVTATEYGLIADGERLHPSGEGEIAALWNSTDGGVTWVEIEPGRFDDELVGPVAVAPNGTVVVAVGNRDDFAIWASRDLQSWDYITSPDFAGPDIQQVHSIAWGGSAFVAVGDDGMSAGVWLSRDGFEWTKVYDEALLPSEWGAASMFDVAAGGPGYVAVGSVGFRMPGGTLDNEPGASIWVSESGYEWDLLVVEDPGEEGLLSVEADPATGRLIAFGGDRWYSIDGYEWEWVDRTVPFGGPPPGSRVAWDDNLAVAAGWERSGLSLWVSADAGDTWNRVDPDHPAFEWCSGALSVVEQGGRFVVSGFTAGTEGCYAELIPALWIGTPQE